MYSTGIYPTQVAQATAGESIFPGQVLRRGTGGQVLVASTGSHHCVGVALCWASASQPVFYASAGEVKLGASVTPGAPYYLTGSGTDGALCPYDDVTTNWPMTMVCVGYGMTGSVRLLINNAGLNY